MDVKIIEIDAAAATNEEWQAIMAEKLKTASRFEIHCWNKEQHEIAEALQWGVSKCHSWRNGSVIEGEVTKEFADYILSLPKPDDTAIYNKMTPFFSIFLDNGFSSEHYGTELNQALSNEQFGSQNR